MEPPPTTGIENPLIMSVGTTPSQKKLCEWLPARYPTLMAIVGQQGPAACLSEKAEFDRLIAARTPPHFYTETMPYENPDD